MIIHPCQETYATRQDLHPLEISIGSPPSNVSLCQHLSVLNKMSSQVQVFSGVTSPDPPVVVMIDPYQESE